jgi:hypothetical protein
MAIWRIEREIEQGCVSGLPHEGDMSASAAEVFARAMILRWQGLACAKKGKMAAMRACIMVSDALRIDRSGSAGWRIVG